MCNLSERRQAAGLTQKDLAARAGTTHNTICRVECGLRPSYKLAERIAAALGCELSDLWPGAELPGMIRVPTKGGAA